MIRSLEPSRHFGDWKCEASSWGSSAAAMINVGEALPVEVEFVRAWGNVLVDLGMYAFAD